MTRALLAVWLVFAATPLAAQDRSRDRMRRLQLQPLGPAAQDPRRTLREILDSDPRFTRIDIDTGVWRERLSRQVHELGEALRARPIAMPRSTRANAPTPEPVRPRQLPWVNLPEPPARSPRRLPWSALPLPARAATEPTATQAPATRQPSEPWIRPLPWGALPAPPDRPGPSSRTRRWGAQALIGAIVGTGLIAMVAIVGLVAASRLFAWPLAQRWLPRLLAFIPATLARRLARWASLPEAGRPQPSTPARPTLPAPQQHVPAPVLAVLPEPEPLRWDAEARRLFERGDTREALRDLVRQCLAVLDAHRVIRFDPSRTNWEYRQELSPGPLRNAFGELCRAFDRAWYGEQPVDREAFERAAELAGAAIAETTTRRTTR